MSTTSEEIVGSTAGEIPAEVDSGKRTFLRLLGLLGVGVAATSLFPGKADAFVLGGAPTSPIVGSKNASNVRINPATEDTLGLVQGQTAKLSFDGSSNLYVQAASNFASQLENASSTIINPATEDSLAAVKTQVNKLTFDSSNNLMTTGGSAASGIVGVKDTTGAQVNPSTDESLILLRRMVKVMESQASVDTGNRQRVTIDAIGTAGTITTTIPVTATATLAAGTAVAGSMLIDGQGRQMFTEMARQAYNSGIRSNLSFS